jgi:cytochrome c-type biogenesis protein CcmH/NrfG
MLLLQVPVPPVPPELPQVIVHGGPPGWVGFVAAVSLVAAAILLYPVLRLEGRRADPALRGEMDQLHDRMGDLERLEARVIELENRIEFSERLLTRARDAESGPREGRS